MEMFKNILMAENPSPVLFLTLLTFCFNKSSNFIFGMLVYIFYKFFRLHLVSTFGKIRIHIVLVESTVEYESIEEI